jgi:hypothetical protein
VWWAWRRRRRRRRRRESETNQRHGYPPSFEKRIAADA